MRETEAQARKDSDSKLIREKLELSLPISDPYLESLSLVTSSWGGEDDQKKAAKRRKRQETGGLGRQRKDVE